MTTLAIAERIVEAAEAEVDALSTRDYVEVLQLVEQYLSALITAAEIGDRR